MISLQTIHWSKLTFFVLSGSVGIFFSSHALVIVSLALLVLILFERHLKINIPSGIAGIFVAFIVLSLILGSYFNFYEKFPWWDDLLHAFYGAAFALVGFLIIQYISTKRNIENDILIICLFSFCFSVAFGALWEIYEFAYDQFFSGNMQRTDQGTGVTDTMNDIILESSSAFLVNVFIYFYIASGTKNWVGKIWESFLKVNTNT